ncbi:MAG TPA: Rne/Rng family ribonuclease [Candidatus Cloacimonadota bacterium]|nr:Rne/Rng family ribonuclease [Candidatus Cloacimonadota bacterium]
MFTELIVNVHSMENRIAVLEDNQLVELFVEKENSNNIVGNLYKGIVKDVLPGMGAAFIDIGLERTAFLHYSNIATDFIDDFEGEEHEKIVPEESHRIAEILKPGQEILVQIQKGPIGAKGARLTGQISIPGKILVYFPNKSKIFISRKINSPIEKQRIRSILSEIKDPNTGIIVRTEGEHCSEEEFVEEYRSLAKTWKFLEKKINNSKAPCCIFEESDPASILIRDLFSSNVDRLVIDDKDFYQKVILRIKDYNPTLCDRVEHYAEETQIFDAFGIEKEIEKLFYSRIYLPSGGNIVIESTEALTAIDINTGSYTGSKNYEATIKHTNLEAAVEIVRQIRLRNLSGIVIVDFIDMQEVKSRQEVLDTLRKAFRRDRAKNKVFPFGQLGLVEITRKRTRTSLMNTYLEHCPHCNGTGRVLSRESVLIKINRWLARAEYFISNRPLDIYVHPAVKQAYDSHPELISCWNNKVNIFEQFDLDQDMFRIILADEKKDITTKYNP